MKLTIFKAADGDCNLITGRDGKHILVDGGRTGAFREHVAPALEAIHARDEVIDLLCVSHIDNDHISGVIELLERKTRWAVHRYQVHENDNASHPRPDYGEPPRVDRIWHNGFREQIGENEGAIEEQLAANARFAQYVPGTASAQRFQAFHTGVKESIVLQRKLRAGWLHMRHNEESEGRLLLLNDPPNAPAAVGGMQVQLLGPYGEDLIELRKEWNEWVRKNRDTIADLSNRIRRLERDLPNDLDEPDRVRWARELAAAELGDFSTVTAPNVATISFLVSEQGRSILMTGDAVSDFVLEGMEHAGTLAPGGSKHVDVLKVPHHGASANTSAEFARRLTADHYVFCGNGNHTNPEIDALDAYIKARLDGAGPDRPFHFWFTYDPETNGSDLTKKQREHMVDVRARVDDPSAQWNGRLTTHFISGSSGVIDLDQL